MVNFYDNYLRLCNAKKITPSRAAVEAGTTKTSVNRWKNGSRPSDAMLLKLADYFQCSIEDLIGSEGDTEKAPPAGDGEGRYGLQKRDWWGIGQWFKHELDVIARPPEYLANKSGIPLDRVEAFLVGNAELSKVELESLAKVIGKPLGEIIHGYEAALEKEDDPVDLAAYLQVFGSLSSEEQKDLVQIAVLSGKIGPAAAKGISTLRALLESQMPPSQG